MDPIWYLRDHIFNFTLVMPRSIIVNQLMMLNDNDLRVVEAGPFTPTDTEPFHVHAKKKATPEGVTSRGSAPTDANHYTLVERIRQAFPIASFVAPHSGGLKPSRNGWFTGRCPFHQSPEAKGRKFWVNPAKGICGCFVPRCPAHKPPLDVINFYAKLSGISNSQAIKELEARL